MPRRLLSICAGLALSSAVSLAHARSGGIAAEGCNGCHSSTFKTNLTLDTNPPSFEPGSQVEVLVTLSGGTFNAGGVYVTTKGVGTLQALANEGLASEANGGLVHVQPKPASGGNVQFRFAWQAPGTPGAVRFWVYALAANADGQRSGDAPVDAAFDRVYGCEGAPYYIDFDADGFGRESSQPTLACAGTTPPQYATQAGDCNDYDKAVFPGAPELCNKHDDDCDGEVDEDALPVELWPDEDGDGYYYEQTGEPVTGCVGLEGYAAVGGDCQPDDPNIHPDAEELCNYLDDNCDGEADERVRPACGEGWCRRASATCEEADCYPGAPVAERCNYLDDDCDGEVDEGDLCDAGQLCVAGQCIDSDMLAAGGSGVGGGATAGSGTVRRSTTKPG